MKFDFGFRPEECVSSDREHLSNVHLDVGGGRDGAWMVSTDGHVLVAIPVECSKSDRSGPLPPGAFAEARRTKTNLQAKRRMVNGFVRAETKIPFPDEWRGAVSALRPGSKGTVTFCFNPALLKRIVKSLGPGASESVCMTVAVPRTGERMLDPITIRPHASVGERSAIAALMPMLGVDLEALAKRKEPLEPSANRRRAKGKGSK